MSPMVKLPLTLEHALLGFLWQRPMHAYEIYQTMMQAGELGIVWRLKQSQLYALLGRLEEAGYITAVTEPQGSRPPRRVMSLTADGHDAFRRWLLAPIEHGRDVRQEFLAKLYFAKEEPAIGAALIDGQQAACRRWIAALRRQIEETPQERLYDRLVLEFRAGQVQAIITWLDTCAATLLTVDTTERT